MWVTDMHARPIRRCPARSSEGKPGLCGKPGVHVITVGDIAARAAPYQTAVGDHVCTLHAPRACVHCGHWIPWFDGSVCDFCDRYMDEGD